MKIIIPIVASLLLGLNLDSRLLGQDDYQEWLKKQNRDFQTYVTEQDRIFADFLKAEWQNLNAFMGVVPDTIPKPVKIPVYKPPKREPKLKPPPVTKPVKIPDIPKPKPTPKPTPEKRPKPPKVKTTNTVNVVFLGISLKVEVDKKMMTKLEGQIGKEYVSDYWQQIAQAPYAPTLQQAMYYKDQLDLNDWGYGILLWEIGKGIYGEDQNLTNLFTWFMLLKSGYDAKVGYTKERIVLLVPSTHLVYGIPYYRLEGSEQKYYTIAFGKLPEKSKTSLLVYQGDYLDAQTLMDFSVRKVPSLEHNLNDRIRQFSYNGSHYEVPIKINQGIVDLYRYYPLSSMTVFFDTAISPSVDHALLSSLGEIIDGRSETEAVNILLRFVQTAFDYQTDQEQFGREKYLIPDETLFYSYCDCEDRSILFSHLVRKLVGLPVIGLDYPGHIATAVSFNGNVTGDAVQYQDRRYVICDPTYINADIGMTMPQFKDTPPELIGLP